MRPAIVAVVPTQNGGEPLVLRGQWRVHKPSGILAQRRQLGRQAFPFRLVLHVNRPSLVRPKYWVKPRKAKVSGRRAPRR